jgi:hypothetical protein
MSDAQNLATPPAIPAREMDKFAAKVAAGKPVLYSRYGKPWPVTFTSPRGLPFYVGTQECNRCDGTGRYSFNGSHSICYRCDGRRYDPVDAKIRLYTAEENAALDAKEEAKRAAAVAAAELKIAAAVAEFSAAYPAEWKFIESNLRHFHPDTGEALDGEDRGTTWLENFCESHWHNVQQGKETPAQLAALQRAMARQVEFEARKVAAKAVAAASQWVGSVGDKWNGVVTIEKIFKFEARAFNGYGMDTMGILKMRDSDGNTIVWKGRFYGSNPFYSNDRAPQEGDVFEITAAKIKELTEYKGEKQTRLAYVKAERKEG